MKTVLGVQARMGSTRLPGKVLLSLGNRRVIEWVCTRCQAAEMIDRVVLAIGDESPNDAVTEWSRRAGYRHLVGPESDLLFRHRRVAAESGADTYVRVTGDCPFVPPTEIDRVIQKHKTNDARYTTNHTDSMPIGTAVDVLAPGLLEELSEQGETHPVRSLREHPDTYRVQFTENPDWTELSGAHVAVDTPEDYWMLTDAVDAVGTDPMAVARWVANQD